MTAMISIRRAEPGDYAAMHRIFAGPKVVRGTLQLPFPSLETWRQRLAEPPEGAYTFVACVEDEVVGQVHIQSFPHKPQRGHAGHQPGPHLQPARGLWPGRRHPARTAVHPLGRQGPGRRGGFPGGACRSPAAPVSPQGLGPGHRPAARGWRRWTSPGRPIYWMDWPREGPPGRPPELLRARAAGEFRGPPRRADGRH
jgi:hypothetical protein